MHLKPIDVQYNVTEINSMRFVTEEQMQASSREAARRQTRRAPGLRWSRNSRSRRSKLECNVTESLCVFLVVRKTNEDGSVGGVHIRAQNGVVTERSALLKSKRERTTTATSIYQGGVLNRTGDNITAGLGLANDPLSQRMQLR